MRAVDVALTLTTPATNALALSQTPGGAGALTLNGTLTSGGALSLATAHQLNVTSAANISAVTFTFTGTDADGFAQTEVVTGPNIATVSTTKYYKTISSVTVSGAPGAALTAGVADRAISATIPMAGRYQNDSVVGVQIDVSGTVSVTVQQTMQAIAFDAAPFLKSWKDHDTLVAVTADITHNYIIPISAMRFITNSYTTGATVMLSYVQN